MCKIPSLLGLALLLGGTVGCPQPAPLDDAPCTFSGTEPGGILLTVAVHYRSFEDGDLGPYQQVAEEVDWIADWADRHGLVLELALNGYQAEGALVAGQTERYAALADRGHSFGVHHHPNVRQGVLTWVNLGEDPGDAELQQSVDDHRAWVGQTLDPLGIEYPGGHVRLTGRSEWWAGMMEDSGYSTETVEQWAVAATGGAEPDGEFDVLHPFRWRVCDDCGDLAWDAGVPFVAVPQHPQVGRIGQGEHLDFDGTVPHLQTTLLLAYLEYRAEILAGGAPAVWTFGVTIHPELGASQNGDLERFAAFAVDQFLAPPDDRIGRSACAAGRPEVLSWQQLWEQTNPDDASFEFRPGDPYPYRLPQLATAYHAHLVAIHDGELDRGVRIAELQQVEPDGAGGFEPGETMLVVWADLEEGEVTVDLREWFDSRVRVTDSVGSEQQSSARSVKVGGEPIVVESG